MITAVLAPLINTNDDEVQIVAWHVVDGAHVEAGQELAELETSKTTMTLEAERAGYVTSLLPVKATVRVGVPVCKIVTSPEELGTPAQQPAAVAAPAPAAGAANGSDCRGVYASARFSKAAAELLERHALSADAFQGAGLVTAQRVRLALGLVEPARPVSQHPAATEAITGATPTTTANSHHQRVSRAKEAEIAALSLGAGGHINSTLSVRFDSAPIRARLRRERLFDGNLLPLALYEISRLLPRWPQLTAFFEDGAVHYYGRIDLGLAMDLGKGLKVVTIRNADLLSPAQLFEHTLDCGARYLENRLQADELLGSTLTVTDLSGFGILQFQPLINGRQSAIIGLGGDETLPGHPMTINLTFDHRVASGRDMALFLGELRARLRSYAPSDATAAHVVAAAGAGAAQPSNEQRALVRNGGGAPGLCERCGVDAASYYDGFARDGYLLAFYRPDGSLGGVCHRCFGSWN
ncbi:MAG: 2-oxo acid dehydrogenase subunit E2 [Gammaproteobacteria bacterium]|nr:2-oxo acid dehydrogenase subunit E2 [Gammaproteobacteria bacterium]